MHQYDVLIWTGIVFVLLFLFSFFLRFFGVPYVLSFMLVGILGKWIFHEKITDWLALLEHSAVAFLFFFIGLEYSFERLSGMRRIIKPALADFLMNFLAILTITYIFTRNFYFSAVVASALYPSSTAITVKLLSDYRRLALPEAELLIGILIFEDLVSIVLLSLFGGKVGALSLPIVFFSFYLLRNLAYKLIGVLDRISHEVIFPFLIVGALLFLCGFGELLGISSALIAFMLGIIIPEGSLTFKVLEEKLSYLKELALGVFFFSFTYHTSITFGKEVILALFLAVVSVVTKIISTYLASRFYGLSRKSSLRASLSFLSRGEFSVVFSSLLPSTQTLVLFVVFITSILGSLSFVYAPKIANLLTRAFPKPP